MSVIYNILNLIHEMSYSRINAIGKIENLSVIILHHLIKILKWEDEINYNKHINDINNWISDIQEVTIKPKRKRFDHNTYYLYLFENIVKSKIDITKQIKNVKLLKYKNLKVIRTDKEVYKILKEVYTKISKDISNNNFENIKNYL